MSCDIWKVTVTVRVANNIGPFRESTFTMRSKQSLLAVLCTLLLATCALGDEKPCTIHDNGKFYDLNPLKSRYTAYFIRLFHSGKITK